MDEHIAPHANDFERAGRLPERLLEQMSDAYATTLDEDAATAYRLALYKKLRKRFPQLADALRVALDDDPE